MTVYETEVPGVGKKYELSVGDGERLVVLIHHDGQREVYRRPAADADSEKLFELDATQARQFGAILDGAYFEPVQLDEVQVPLGDAIIEWTTLESGSPLAATTLADANVRGRTGVSILAVQRGEETYSNPKPSFELREDDVIVTLGDREEQVAMSSLVEPATGDESDDGTANSNDADRES